jgi:uncharacterized protein (DUF2267 family)
MTTPGTPALSPSQRDLLLVLAARYVWWKTPEEAMRYPQRVIAQVMNIGTQDDANQLTRAVSDETLREVLQAAEGGQFTAQAWQYWHYRLRLAHIPADVPPLPKRFIPLGD